MEKGQMVRIPAWVWSYAQRAAADEGLRTADVLNRILKFGVERCEVEKAEVERNKRLIGELRAVV